MLNLVMMIMRMKRRDPLAILITHRILNHKFKAKLLNSEVAMKYAAAVEMKQVRDQIHQHRQNNEGLNQINNYNLPQI